MALLNIGTDLSGRVITTSFPNDFDIYESKVVVRGNSNCSISEEVDGATKTVKYTTPSGTGTFWTNGTAEQNVKLPDDFGAVTEIDETAASYPYLSRVDNEKVYLITEDLGRLEYYPEAPIRSNLMTAILSEYDTSGISAYGTKTITFDISAYSSMLYIGVQSIHTDDDKISIMGYYKSGNNFYVIIRNHSSGTVSSVSVDAKLTFLKS